MFVKFIYWRFGVWCTFMRIFLVTLYRRFESHDGSVWVINWLFCDPFNTSRSARSMWPSCLRVQFCYRSPSRPCLIRSPWSTNVESFTLSHLDRFSSWTGKVQPLARWRDSLFRAGQWAILTWDFTETAHSFFNRVIEHEWVRVIQFGRRNILP